jgi:phosphate transport system permease protein
MKQSSPNPFAKRPTFSKFVEVSSFWIFRIATYLVIAAAAYIFGDIAVKGGAVVFRAQAPFINIPFLTEWPETLDIFKVPGNQDLKMEVSQYKRFKGENLDVAFTEKGTVQMVILQSAEGLTKKVFKQDLANLEADPTYAGWKTNGEATLQVFTFPQETTLKVGNTIYRKFAEDNAEELILEHKTQVYAAGGIYPAIVGTVLLVVGSMMIALVLGVLCATYLSEYSRSGPLIHFIRLSIMNLAGVPSIVFGMWGYAMFVLLFGWNVSLMAGWFTLAFMVLPIVITGSEESLRAVPQGFREGSLALGASKWQTIRKNVLPYAMPGILTSSIMGIARIAGETAAIMFTAAFVVRDELPWQVQHVGEFFFNGVMALPYHIFVVSARVPQNIYTEKVQYGTAFIFMLIVLAIAFASIMARSHVRKKYKW